MRSVKSVVFRVAALLALFQSASWATAPPVPMSVLQDRADVIVVASLRTATRETTGTIRAQLQPLMVLKGQMPASPALVELAPSWFMQQLQEAPATNAAGATGLWFLKQGSNGTYEVVPTGSDRYTWQYEAFLPIPAGWSPPTSATLSQKLLSALAAWYRSFPHPDEYRLLASLEKADRQDSLAVADELMAPTESTNTRVTGFVAAIILGSDAALLRLAQEVETLRSHPKFDRIIMALKMYYRPQGPSSLVQLRQLIELRSDAPGLDVAVAAALVRAGNKSIAPGLPDPALANLDVKAKDVLPIMALLLDSRDPNAQLGAAWSFGQFTALADPNGDTNLGYSTAHPFWTDDTHRYMPRRNSTIPAEVYASFWKTWWAENRAKLGFPAQ